MSAQDSFPPFTIVGYRLTISGILDRGYRLASFHDVDLTQPHLVLRHDIDQTIASARVLADVESAEGWTSTWFVLMRSEMYNPFSRQAAADLRAMQAAGHEIGLHLDATLYEDADAIARGAASECRMLEEIIAVPVRMISFHRPLPQQLGGNAAIAGRPHTYMDRFTKDIGYCSDSRGMWRHGHPWQHPALQRCGALQLLTHAVWWAGEREQSPRERLAAVLRDRAAVLDDELRANNDVWRGHFNFEGH